MPSVYTHCRFGIQVNEALRRSNAPIAKEIVPFLHSNWDIFLIGLQGPDILFHYHPLKTNPVSQLGHQMHDATATEFLLPACTALDELPRPNEALAYLLGFICHFALDSECHSYIEHRILTQGDAHVEIETALDKHFLIEDRRKLKSYNPAAHLKCIKAYNQTIGALLGVKEDCIQQAIFSIRFTFHMLMPAGALQDGLVRLALKASGTYNSHKHFLMRDATTPSCCHSTQELVRRYEQAIPLAIELMESLYLHRTKASPLSPRFDRTFGPYEPDMAEYADG